MSKYIYDESAPEFTSLPDLASRVLAGSVVSANDELFAQRENLITPGRADFDVNDFGHKGKVYDGWETRRRREPGSDHAVIRLGVPGIVRGVVVDTSWFKGNYPPHISVEAASLAGFPSTQELDAAEWTTLVAKADALGHSDNFYEVADGRRWTHVRLTIYPDGGVARFRVHGEPVPDPRLLTGTVDLVALENGGRLVGCSDAFYSSPAQIIEPGRARIMGDGWENARRRGGGNDHATFKLGVRGQVRRVEIDTSYFVGNAAGWALLRGTDTAEVGQDTEWTEIVPKTRLQPDTRHFFRINGATPFTHVRLDVYPDGGLARLRVNGEILPEDLQSRVVQWLDQLPEQYATTVLQDDAGLSEVDAANLLAQRPFGSVDAVPRHIITALLS